MGGEEESKETLYTDELAVLATFQEYFSSYLNCGTGKGKLRLRGEQIR